MDYSICCDTRGCPRSLAFMDRDSDWLRDSEVMVDVRPEKGRFVIYLVFVSIHDPSKVLRRRITEARSEREAHLKARLYQRTAQKDPRGTLRVRPDAAFRPRKN
ncbi:MAG: hypothetical protein AAF624_08745 [Bacteroidota bacterium]